MTDAPNPDVTASAPAEPVVQALRGAIASVEAAVVRLAGDDAAPDLITHVLELSGASLPGDVVTLHNSLTRAASIVDHGGALSDAEWSSLAGLGPDLDRTVALLREHASDVLDRLDPGAGAGEHVELLQTITVDEALGETFQLLVLVEDCLFLWHRVRLARSSGGVSSGGVRTVLAGHFDRDAVLLRRSRAALARFAEGTPIEVVRRLSSGRTTRVLAQLRQDLDDFRWACRADEAGWLAGEDPVIAEALDSIDSPLKAVGGVLGDAFEWGRARVTAWNREENKT